MSVKGAPESVNGARVSPDFFTTANGSALMGRFITDYDLQPGASRVVVLSYDYWKKRFDGTHDIIGSVITVNGQPATIIAVAQRGFDVPDHAQMWMGGASR